MFSPLQLNFLTGSVQVLLISQVRIERTVVASDEFIKPQLGQLNNLDHYKISDYRFFYLSVIIV